MNIKVHLTNIKSLNNNCTFVFGCLKASISTNGVLSTTNQSTLDDGVKPTTFSFDEQVTKAEIMWALSANQREYSFNSCDDMSLVFRSMFRDSKIAEHLPILQKKMSYLISYSLGPHSHRELIEDAKINETLVLCSAEQTNQQKTSSYTSYWDIGTIRRVSLSPDTIELLYLAMHQANVLHDFKAKSLKYDGLALSRLLMLGRDNPSVNKLLENLIEKEMGLPGGGLPKIGSCNLHVVHNAFRAGNCRVFFAETKIHLTPGFSFILLKVFC